jgi:tripartite-type tricarboxylate transporter receptor subunit TctC
MNTAARFVAGAALLACAGTGYAQAYPSRLVRILNAQGPGTLDVISRGYAQHLTKKWGQPVVVEQRAGAGSIVAAELVAKADPDGHTLLVSSSAAYTVNQWITKDMPYDPGRDLAPLFGLGISVPTLTVTSKLGVSTVQELIALVKANPGKYTFGSAGIGSATHLQAEVLLQELGGLKMLHVPYKGIADVARAIVAGEVHMAYPAKPLVMGGIKKGQARVLAVVGDERDPELPDVPMLKEVVPGATGSLVWFGFAVPIRTPNAIIQKIAADMLETSREEDVKDLMRKANFNPMHTGPKEFGAVIARERALVGKLIKELGLDPK